MKKHIATLLLTMLLTSASIALYAASETEALSEAAATPHAIPKPSTDTVPEAPPIQKQAEISLEEKQQERQREHAAREIALSVLQQAAEKTSSTQAREEEIKEEEAQALPGAETLEPNPRALLIFLDDGEIKFPEKANTMTKAAMTALYQKTGPLLITGALLAHIFDIYGDQDIYTREFRSVFHKQFDATEWNIYQLDTFFLLIPQHYLKNDTVSLEDFNNINHKKISLANQQDALSLYFNENNQEKYNFYRDKAADPALAHNFLKLLFNLLSKTNNAGEINWIIYMEGHGGYGRSIATLSIKNGLSKDEPPQVIPSQFQQFLNFLNTKIKTKILIIQSCYAAGFNAKEVYGELTHSINTDTSDESLMEKKEKVSDRAITDIRTYPFTIVTGATTDAPTHAGQKSLHFENTPMPEKNALASKEESDDEDDIPDDAAIEALLEKNALASKEEGTILSEVRYDLFVESLVKQKSKFSPMIASLVFPRVISASSSSEALASIPLVRPANTPSWFPIVDYDKAVIRIGNIMAATRKKPLLITQYKDITGKMNDPRAILLATKNVPFPIIIDASIATKPPFISLLPGKQEHIIESLEYQGVNFNRFNIKDIVDEIAYGDTKTYRINNLHIINNKKESKILKDVEIKIKDTIEEAIGYTENGESIYDDYGFIDAEYESKGEELLKAVKAKDLPTVTDLLINHKVINHKALINYFDLDRNTALHLACSAWPSSDYKIIKLLLQHNADPNLENEDGESPRDLDTRLIKKAEQELAKEKQENPGD